MRFRRSSLMSRWLFPLLVVSVMLGHACDWHGLADLGWVHAADADHHGDGHHHRDGHDDGVQIACEPVQIAVNTGFAPSDSGFASAVAPRAVALPDLARLASAAKAPEAGVPRPPLYVLHASLLI
jgi:hypothetical protein